MYIFKYTSESLGFKKSEFVSVDGGINQIPRYGTYQTCMESKGTILLPVCRLEFIMLQNHP